MQIASVSAFMTVIVLVMALVYSRIGNLKVVIRQACFWKWYQVVYFIKASLQGSSARFCLYFI